VQSERCPEDGVVADQAYEAGLDEVVEPVIKWSRSGGSHWTRKDGGGARFDHWRRSSGTA